MKDNLNINNNTHSTYRDYLNSKHWKALRREINDELAAEDSRFCYVCNNSDKIQLHHRTYKRLGCELRKDLVVLCGRCHRKVHKIAKAGKSNLYNAHVYLRRKLGLKLENKKPIVRTLTVIPERRLDCSYPIIETDIIVDQRLTKILNLYQRFPSEFKQQVSRKLYYDSLRSISDRLEIDLIESLDIFVGLCSGSQHLGLSELQD